VKLHVVSVGIDCGELVESYGEDGGYVVYSCEPDGGDGLWEEVIQVRTVVGTSSGRVLERVYMARSLVPGDQGNGPVLFEELDDTNSQ
jgi:hypothetical protein